MKTKLNALCACVIIMLILSASMMGSTMFSGAKAGYEAAANTTKLQVINTLPSDLLAETGTVTNLKDSSELSIKPIVSFIAMPSDYQESAWSSFADILALVILIAGVYALVQFFKLVRNINRGIIFDWKNVRILRKQGWALIAVFLSNFGFIAIGNYEASQVISLNGCDFSVSVVFSDPVGILGFVSLLVGEIFSIGLKMKEEQDLTI